MDLGLSGLNVTDTTDVKKVNEGSDVFDNANANANAKKMNRHCGYCRQVIPFDKVKCCAKCGKRAYCGRECQLNDWKPKNIDKNGYSGVGVGQGHKSWCGLPYGEEDLDWEVRLVDEKGIGIFAKRFFPANSRIMVDSMMGLPGDLRCDDGFLLDEYKVADSLGPSQNLKHACGANASQDIDGDFNVMVVFSKRDIAPGEQVTVNVMRYNDNADYKSDPHNPGRFLKTFADCRRILAAEFAILCPPDCLCWNKEMDELIAESRRIQSRIMELEEKNPSRKNAAIALENVEKLLGLLTAINASSTGRANVLEMGWRFAVMQNKTLKLGEQFIKEASEIWSNVLHPQSSSALMDKAFMQFPGTYGKYLILER